MPPIRRPRILRTRPRSRGQAVVEFALILPVFLMMTIGVVDMARIFTSYISLSNGVREAALFAGQATDNVVYWCDPAVTSPMQCAHPPFSFPTPAAAFQHADPDNVAYRIYVETVYNGLAKANLTISNPVCWTGATLPGTAVTCDKTNVAIVRVQVTSSYTVPLLTPVLSSIFSSGVTVSASTTAQVQGR
jgi:TadE-like protein